MMGRKLHKWYSNDAWGRSAVCLHCGLLRAWVDIPPKRGDREREEWPTKEIFSADGGQTWTQVKTPECRREQT